MPEKGHSCELPEDLDGLSKLSPNAPFRVKIARRLRRLLAPNSKAAICKRNYRNQSQINTERRRHAHGKFILVIHPYSDLEFYRELMFIFIGLWKIITSPLYASFGYVWRIGDDRSLESNLPNLIVFVLEIIWIFSCFFAAYKDPRTKIIQINQCKIIKRYLLTYLVIDLLSLSFPYDNDVYGAYIYWINLAIFGRMHTIITYMKRFLNDAGVPETIVIFITLIALSFFVVHVLACIFYILPFQINEKESELWLVKTNLHPNASLITVYFGCFSMVQTHFWGIGEASVRVRNVMENLILIFTMIMGRLWSLYLLATMLRVFTISSLSESKYEEYLTQLKIFIAQKQIPKDLADRLLEYYRYKYQHHYFNERAIFNAMSNFLKQELLLYSARNVINKVTIFKHFPRSLIGSIIAKCKIMVFLNHDVICNVGDLMENIYFISCGTVAVFNRQGVELLHLTDGEEIGIRGIVGTECFRNTYTAIETTEMYVISLKDFRAIIYSKSDILKYFSKRIEDRVEELKNVEIIASAQGVDLLSALRHGKVLERPRIRTRYFEN